MRLGISAFPDGASTYIVDVEVVDEDGVALNGYPSWHMDGVPGATEDEAIDWLIDKLSIEIKSLGGRITPDGVEYH